MKIILLGLALICASLNAAAPRHASWYGEEYRGKTMANGRPFIPEAMTCATNHWPMGSVLRVTHGEKAVEVIVTDRTSRKYRHRIDLSEGAFKKLAHPDKGVIVVKVTRIRE